jgi:hypothetical protein
MATSIIATTETIEGYGQRGIKGNIEILPEKFKKSNICY